MIGKNAMPERQCSVQAARASSTNAKCFTSYVHHLASSTNYTRAVASMRTGFSGGVTCSGGRSGGTGRINTVTFRASAATIISNNLSPYNNRPTITWRQTKDLAAIRSLARLMAVPRGVAPGTQTDRRGARTPPERLVSTFDFLTYSNATATSYVPAAVVTEEPEEVAMDTTLEVKEWEGRVVFSETTPWPAGSAASPSHTKPAAGPSPSRTPPKQQTTSSHGSSASPISVSDSSPERDLPRPRVRAKYSPLASTAYTPPRPAEQPKPVHPFFQRDFRRSRSTPPPPAVNKPRLVAQYSSTSVTDSSQSQSSQDSWRVNRRTEIELVSHKIESRRYSGSSSSSRGGSEAEEPLEHKLADYRVDEVDAMLRELELNPTGVGSSSTSKVKAKATTVPATRRPLTPVSTLPVPEKAATGKDPMIRPVAKPKPIKAGSSSKSTNDTVTEAEPRVPPTLSAATQKVRSVVLPALPKDIDELPELPYFSYKHLTSPPKVVYTQDVNEANDILECVTGKVIGFDLEWPTKAYDPIKRRYHFSPGKTALMQIGDERLVLLMHVWHMPRLPIKAVEMLMDKSVYKLGVQIRGDEAKLTRDYPEVFPNGIESTVDLSHIARRADPVVTGPGNTLIALNTLARTYLGRQLDKGDVRRGDWSKKLDSQQIEYAANDVASSIEIYKALLKVARSNAITIDLENLTAGGTSVLAQLNGRAGAAGAVTPPGTVTKIPLGVPPREWNALNLFKGGLTLREAASQLNIKETTIYSYVAGALAVLPEDTTTVEQKVRFLAEVPRTAFVYKQHPKVFRRLREATGETVSDTEAEHAPR